MKRSWLILLFLVAAITCCLNIFCHSGSKNETAGNVYLNHNDSVKYVGIQTCRGCHNDIYNTFIETGMGQSFAPVSRQKSAADFSRHHVVYDKFSDLYYHPFWEADSMYIMEYRLSGKDTVHKRIERVDYIIGSGQHTNSHMTNINGFVYQLPLTWYAQKGKWDLPPGFENGHNVRFSRAIGMECMSCHNALPGFSDNSLNKFISVPNGIDCERCHGPGELHVREKAAGNLVDTATQTDYTIVNPRKLSWERQTDICQRCHLQGNVVLKPGKTFRDFRPGKVLSDYMDVYMPKYKGREDEFIMASHAQRLQMSKCFIVSAQTAKGGQVKGLTCITCHNPHVSVKVTGKQVFNNACGNCHSMQNDCKAAPAQRKAVNDNCVGCHMPRSGTIDIPHVTVTDHRIHIPAKTKDKQELREFAGIYCINNPRSDQQTRTEAYLNYVEKFEGEPQSLDSAAYYLRSLDMSDHVMDLRVHFMFLKKDDVGIVQFSRNMKPAEMTQPWMCYRIGQAYQNLQDPAAAEMWYSRAHELVSENLDFLNKLGTARIEQDKLSEGIANLEESLGKNPKQSSAWTNLGFAYLRQGNSSKALSCYNRAIALDPDFEQALLNKAAVLRMSGDRAGAKKLLQQILKRNPGNELVKQLLLQV